MHRAGEVCSTVAQTSTLDAVRGCDGGGGDGHHPPPLTDVMATKPQWARSA